MKFSKTGPLINDFFYLAGLLLLKLAQCSLLNARNSKIAGRTSAEISLASPPESEFSHFSLFSMFGQARYFDISTY